MKYEESDGTSKVNTIDTYDSSMDASEQFDTSDLRTISMDKNEKYLNYGFETIIFKILQYSKIFEKVFQISDFNSLLDIYNTCADFAYENVKDINVYGLKNGETIHIGRLKSCKKGCDIILSDFYIYL